MLSVDFQSAFSIHHSNQQSEIFNQQF